MYHQCVVQWILTNVRMSQFSSVAQFGPTLCDPVDCSMPGFPVHHQLLELAQTHVHWVSDDIQPSSIVHFSSHLQSFPASGSFIPCKPKYRSFSFSISPYNGYSGLTSLGLTGLISLQSERLSKRLLQHHSLKASVLQCSVFFIVQLSHPYMTMEKP